MSRNELDLAVEWAAAEGWNPGLHDADSFYAADPDGFWVGVLDGEPISCISAVRYGKTFAFVGFYIVKPTHRGQGFGLSLWNKVMASLGERTTGLDGVVDQQANYAKAGFSLAYRNRRYAGKASFSPDKSPCIAPASTIPFDLLVAYDSALFPEPRPAFLKSWLSMPESSSLCYLDNGLLKGLGVIRKCGEGYKIGPLYADSADIAETLYRALSSTLPEGETIYLDTPECNAAAINLAESHEMEMVFETARMYTKEAPQMPLDKVFGVTTFELG